MKNSFYLKLCGFLVTITVLAFPLNELFAQCYIVASEKHKSRMREIWGSTVPDRQGNFATYEECVSFLDREIAFDPVQRAEHWCECEETNSSGTYNTNGQTESRIQVENHQIQLKKLKEAAYKKEMEKKNSDRKIVENKKQDLLGKLKKNKSLDQLKTSSELSEQGEVNISNNQSESGRDVSESAFSDGKIILKKRQEPNTIQVSPPKPVEDQSTLFEYIDRETKVVQNKIIQVQKQKIKLLEKKNDIQKTITDQTLKIEKLKTEKINLEDESKTEEIDSLLIIANQLKLESEELDLKADRDLEEINRMEQDSEALLKKYGDALNKAKEHPEESEQLLKELKGDK
jgi:hypothetical protein